MLKLRKVHVLTRKTGDNMWVIDIYDRRWVFIETPKEEHDTYDAARRQAQRYRVTYNG